MVVASMVASTVDLVMSWSSSTTEPVVLPNSPRTVLMTRCFTAKPVWLWAGSMVQLLVPARASAGTAARSTAAMRAMRFIGFSPLLTLG